MKVEDLDILLPPSRILRIGHKDVDVSFIPCAITFDIDSIIQELSKISQDDILKNGEETRLAFNLSVKLCSTFCEHLYPELDEEFFMNKCDARQIKIFTEAIKDALFAAYSTIQSDSGVSKNPPAPKMRKK